MPPTQPVSLLLHLVPRGIQASSRPSSQDARRRGGKEATGDGQRGEEAKKPREHDVKAPNTPLSLFMFLSLSNSRPGRPFWSGRR